VLGHVVVDLVVRDEALRLAELDQLVAHRVAVARTAERGAAALGLAGLRLHRGRVGLGRGARALDRRQRQVVLVIVAGEVGQRGRVVVVEVHAERLLGAFAALAGGAGLAGLLRRRRREVVVVVVVAVEVVVVLVARLRRLRARLRRLRLLPL